MAESSRGEADSTGRDYVLFTSSGSSAEWAIVNHYYRTTVNFSLKLSMALGKLDLSLNLEQPTDAERIMWPILARS